MFSLGREEGGDAVVAHGKGLAALAAMLEESPALALTLKSPVVSGEEKKAVVGRLLDAIEAGRLLRNFCFLLADDSFCIRSTRQRLHISSCYIHTDNPKSGCLSQTHL